MTRYRIDRLLLIALFLVCYACSAEQESQRDISEEDEETTSSGQTDTGLGTDTGLETDTTAVNTGGDCSPESQKIYLIDSDRTLYSFYPPDKKFEEIGRIDCGAAAGSPFSMSVSRDEVAYVLHYKPLTGNCAGIYAVDIETAECLEKTPFECGSVGMATFGMGFASDSAGSTEETLYIGQSEYPFTLASLDIENWSIDPIGNLGGAPEMTGTGDGELWAFYAWNAVPSVVQLDKQTAKEKLTYPMSQFGGQEAAFAFAHWGGKYYLFLAPVGSTTTVWVVEDGKESVYMANTNAVIVGAGVSTCAPVVI